MRAPVDSPSVFGRLLDPDAGHWVIRPAEDFDVERNYVEDSLVLRTLFRAAGGEVVLTDAALTDHDARGHDLGMGVPHALAGRIEGVRGTVAMDVDFAPRMEYGRTEPHLRHVAGGVVARGGPAQLTLMSPVPLCFESGAARARIVIGEGDVVEFRATYQPSFGPAPIDGPGDTATIEDKLEAWRSLSELHRAYQGRFAHQVRRSAVVLRGLTFQPSGAVVAAATTSLPERMAVSSTSTTATPGCVISV